MIDLYPRYNFPEGLIHQLRNSALLLIEAIKGSSSKEDVIIAFISTTTGRSDALRAKVKNGAIAPLSRARLDDLEGYKIADEIMRGLMTSQFSSVCGASHSELKAKRDATVFEADVNSDGLDANESDQWGKSTDFEGVSS